ncbi:MAG: AAA family ATPase, partial [Prevotellaceae bacterium]|nr:AAA family ATPase [Prevotellaceae bacterium]
MKNLPIGIQSFEKLRERNYLYVDKTKEIHDLIAAGDIYFLSRPRRFGKSLLISTIDAIFSGRKDLFEGLYIYDKWDWSRQYPVIRLDFGRRAFSTPEELKISLTDFIEGEASSHQLSLRERTLAGKFGELIKALHLSAGQKVVVLVDEYDKPITDHLSNPKVMNENKVTLHDFYQVLKASDDHIRFIFLTGVSKFAGVSVFSALNNLDDISLKWRYASVCGYTQAELESNFTEYIDEVALHNSMSREKLLNEIRKNYNGYSWDGNV